MTLRVLPAAALVVETVGRLHGVGVDRERGREKIASPAARKVRRVQQLRTRPYYYYMRTNESGSRNSVIGALHKVGTK